MIVEKHLELLNKKDLLGNIDVQAVSKGVDMGYRIKGSYAPEKTVGVHIHAKVEDLPKLDKLRRDYEERLRQELNEDERP